jgi:hypothetical protein
MRHLITLLFLFSPSLVVAQATNANVRALLQRLEAADLNRDGVITREELRTYRRANFTRLDRDKNGVLTRTDVPAYATMMNPDLNIDALMTQFDGNRDGRVTLNEFVFGPTVAFDVADINNDNVVTALERRTVLAIQKRR